jgi:hypothetical protein
MLLLLLFAFFFKGFLRSFLLFFLVHYTFTHVYLLGTALPELTIFQASILRWYIRDWQFEYANIPVF